MKKFTKIAVGLGLIAIVTTVIGVAKKEKKEPVPNHATTIAEWDRLHKKIS